MLSVRSWRLRIYARRFHGPEALWPSMEAPRPDGSVRVWVKIKIFFHLSHFTPPSNFSELLWIHLSRTAPLSSRTRARSPSPLPLPRHRSRCSRFVALLPCVARAFVVVVPEVGTLGESIEEKKPLKPSPGGFINDRPNP